MQQPTQQQAPQEQIEFDDADNGTADKPTPISEKIREDIRKKLGSIVPAARTYKDTVVEPKDRDRYRTYYGDPIFYQEMFPKLSQNSSIVDTSVRQAIKRQLAALVKMFFGTDDVGTITGRTAQSDANAEAMQNLCNFQILYQMQGYLKFSHWFTDALVILLGVIKITWCRETEQTDEVQTIPAQALEQFAQQAKQNNVKIAMVEPNQQNPAMVDVTISYEKITKNQPLCENVPPSEFMWTPNARSKEDANFFQRKKVTLDYLKRNAKYTDANGDEYGMYDKKAVDKLKAGDDGGDRGTDSPLDITIKDSPYFNDAEIFTFDDPAAVVEIVECYFKHDINSDGLLEDVIATLCGDVLLRCDENTDGNPFCLISPEYDPHRIIPKYGAIDTMAQWQHLLTANIRLLMQNIAQNNSPQIAIQPDMFVDLDQVINGEEFWEVKGDVNAAFKPVIQPNVSPLTLEFIQMIKDWCGEASSVNRFDQSLTSDNALNKTATGLNSMIDQSAQSIESVGRNFTETGVKDAFMRLVFLNQKYIDQDQVIRLQGKDITITPDNLQGDFDYTVDTGMGAGAKQNHMQNMQTLLTLYPQLVPEGLANMSNVYNAVKKMLETMGIKNTDDYIQNPQQAQPKPPAGPKATEQIKIDFAVLPANAKAQLCQMLGLQVTAQDFAIEQANEVDKLYQQETIKQGVAAHGHLAKHIIERATSGGMPGVPDVDPNGNPPNMPQSGGSQSNQGGGSTPPAQSTRVY